MVRETYLHQEVPAISCRKIAVKSRRTFLRRMIDLAKSAKLGHHRIRLSKGFRSDLQVFPTSVEWEKYVGRRGSSQTSGNPDLRCVWWVGLCDVYRWWGVVPAEVARVMARSTSELLPIVVSVATWGGQVGGEVGALSLRQRGGGAHCLVHCDWQAQPSRANSRAH